MSQVIEAPRAGGVEADAAPVAAPSEAKATIGGWSGLLGSMRVRILAAVVLLLAGSSGVSILILRNVLLDRLDEEVALDLSQEIEEFELLAGGLDPRSGDAFSDVESIFDLYFAREVPDEGESLLAFVGDELHHAEIADDAVAPERLEDAIAYWLALEERTEGRLDTAGGRAEYIAVPIARGEQDGLMVVANFPAFERGEIQDAVQAQALTQFAMILVASLIGLGLAGRVLRPLRSLADTAQTITDTDLTRRIPMRGRDEASRIAGAFNDMLERLEQAFVGQRRFLDDASHELRVPLTVIRGHIEILELEVDQEEREETIAVIISEIERMTRIVDDLLLLARAERPGFLSLDRVDLGELTMEVFRNATVLADRRWQLDEQAQGIILADRQRLTQAMMQLAHTACRHTAEGAVIRIGSRVEPTRIRFWIHDEGDGITPGEAEHIFQRFVKGPTSEGSGLGLSIVAAIATAHGGQARVVDTYGRGARFEITIPRSPAVVEAGSEPKPS